MRLASGTPRRRMPTKASASMPRLRSTVSWAIRASDREMRSASITTVTATPRSSRCERGVRHQAELAARCERGKKQRGGTEGRARRRAAASIHLLAVSQERLKERKDDYI